MNEKKLLESLRTKGVQRGWLFLVLSWTVFRSVVVKDVFGKYGVNPWGYFLIDLASGIPYALLSARLVVRYLEKNWRSTFKYGLATVVTFYIPDFFIILTAKEVPRSLFAGLIASIIFFSTLSVLGIVKAIREKATS